MSAATAAATAVGAQKNGDKQTGTAAPVVASPCGVDVRAMRRVMIERWDAKQAEAKRRWAAAAAGKTATGAATTVTSTEAAPTATTATAGKEEGASDGGGGGGGGGADTNNIKTRKHPDADPPDTTLEWRLDGRGGARGERPGVSFTARYAWILRYRTITHRAYEPSRDDGGTELPQRIEHGAGAKTMRLHMLEWAREWPTEVPPAMLAAMTKMETTRAKRKARSDASGDNDSGDEDVDEEQEQQDEKDEGGKRRRRRAKLEKRRRLSREAVRGRRGADGDDDDCSSDSSDEHGLVSEQAFERAEKREREGGDDGDADLESRIDPDVLDLVRRQPRLETDAIDPPPSCGALIPFSDAVFGDELVWRLAAFGHMCRLDAYIRETTKDGYTYHIGLYDVTRTSTEDDGGGEFGAAAESVSPPLAVDSSDRVAV